MEVLRELMKKPRPADSLAIGVFVIAVLYTLVRGTAITVIAGIAFVFMILGALPRQVAVAFLVGASVILLLQKSGGIEGFQSGGSGASEVEPEPAKGSPAAAAEEEAATEKFSNSKVMLPDNATRREPLELGKPYKLPSENDDKGFHLDAGTTFLNAYKALKPDQIAAMTKDTQDLLATQKSLVSMLDSFGPLLKDMNKITGFFGGK
jgi:hypothetical protein